MGPRPPLKIGKRKSKKRWSHSVSQLGRLRPFRSVIPKKFEMSCSRRRFRCVRRTRNELESKLEINTTVLGDEPGMSKEVKILNR